MNYYKISLYILLIIVFIHGFIWALPSANLLDFGSFWASGEAARTGLDPYGVYEHTFIVHTPTFNLKNPNLNPPASLLLFGLLSYIDPIIGFYLMWISSFIAYCTVVIYLSNRYSKNSDWWIVFWALAIPAFWDTLHLGQIYIWLAICSIAAWVLIEKRHNIYAAIFIGILVAFKPNFLVWPILLFLAGQYRLAITSTLMAAGLQVIAGAIYGWQIFVQWWQLVISDTERRSFPTNLSLMGFIQRFDLPDILLLASPILLIVLALIVWSRKPSSEDVTRISYIASIITSPLGWIHYLLIAIPIFFTLKRNHLMDVSMLLMLIPPTIIIGFDSESFLLRITLGSAYFWGTLTLFATIIWRFFTQIKVEK